MMHRLFAALAAIVLTFAPPAAQRAQAADPFEVHAVIPMTGGAAFIGKGIVESFRAYEAIVNKSGGIKGRPLKFVFEDHATNPQTAVQLMTNAFAAHPALIFDGGPVTTCRATAALVQTQVVEYCLSPSIQPVAGSYVFSVSASSRSIINVSIRYLRERGLKRIAVLDGTDATGQDADTNIAAAMKDAENVKAGLTIVADEHYNLTDLSVVAQLSRIKTAQPQALIAYTTGTPIATVLHGLADTGLAVPTITSPGNMSFAQLESYKSFMPKELLFAGPPAMVPDDVTDPAVKKAVNAFIVAMKDAGARPDFLHAIGWDPAVLVVDAYQKLGPDATAAQIHADLAGIRGVSGVLGRYNFAEVPQRGLGDASLLMERWDPDKDGWVAVSKAGGALK